MKSLLFLFLFFCLNISNLNANEKIAFVDLNYILSESNSGKKILQDLNSLSKKNEEIFKSTESDLNDQQNEIKKLKNIISETEYNEKINKLKKEVTNYNKLKADKLKSFENEKKTELDNFFLSLNEILNKYMKENNINIIIEKKSVIMANKVLDVRNNVIKLLDGN